MPTEPERDIEKTLRAYAKKRQEQAGAPAELHPATRRLLQGEVARLRGGKTPEKPSFWAQLFGPSWPRATAGVAALVVMAAAAAALMLPALSKSRRISTLGMAQSSLKDAESLQDYRKLALNSPRPAPADIPDQSKKREDVGVDRSAGETQTYSARKTPAPTSPEGPKEQDLEKNLQLAAKSARQLRDRGIIMQEEAVDKNLAGQPSSAPVPTAPSPAVAAAAPGFDSSAAPAAGSNSRLALELEESHSSRAPALAPATPPVLATTPAALPSGTFSFRSALTNHSLSEAPAGAFPNSASFAGKPSQASTDSLSSPAVTTESGRRFEVASASLGVITNAWSQRFARANSTNNLSRRQRTISRTVLRSFRVEQNGNQIRFIDSDGSVYSGFLREVENDKEPAETLTVAPGAAAVGGKFKMMATNSVNLDGANQTIQNLYFRVSGTNRSLRQPVVVTGNFGPVTVIGRPQKSNFDNRVGGNGSVAPDLGPLNWQLLNSQLQGKVLVGGSNQVDIRALPVNH